MQFGPSLDMVFHPPAPFLVPARGRLGGEIPGLMEILADMSVLAPVERVLLHLLVGALDPLLGGAGILCARFRHSPATPRIMVEVQLAHFVFGLPPLLPKEVAVFSGQSPVVAADRLGELGGSGYDSG